MVDFMRDCGGGGLRLDLRLEASSAAGAGRSAGKGSLLIIGERGVEGILVIGWGEDSLLQDC